MLFMKHFFPVDSVRCRRKSVSLLNSKYSGRGVSLFNRVNLRNTSIMCIPVK